MISICIIKIKIIFLGDIKTLENLDREEIDSYELLVEAIDKGTPSRSSQTLVKILVDDVNDQAPQLLSPANKMLYAAKSRSSLSIGTIIATDKDQNDAITYELQGKFYQTLGQFYFCNLKSYIFISLKNFMMF